MSNSDADLERRRKRALYRANHRGTKEMDWLLGRYAESVLDRLGGDELAAFEAFLNIGDPELQKWLLAPSTVGEPAFAPLVMQIRTFHGL